MVAQTSCFNIIVLNNSALVNNFPSDFMGFGRAQIDSAYVRRPAALRGAQLCSLCVRVDIVLLHSESIALCDSMHPDLQGFK